MAKKPNSFVEAHAMNISVKFQLYPLYSFWVDFEIIIQKFSLLVAMTTNQIESFGHKVYGLVEDHSTNISENFCQNTCNEIAINANFHFSRY